MSNWYMTNTFATSLGTTKFGLKLEKSQAVNQK